MVAFSLLWVLFLRAQDNTVEMADAMRENGKIYVVVAVVLTILIGLFLYLVRLDKKISNIEKEQETFPAHSEKKQF